MYGVNFLPWIFYAFRVTEVGPLTFCVAIDRPAAPPPAARSKPAGDLPTPLHVDLRSLLGYSPTESAARTSACRALSGSCMRSSLYSRVISCSDQSYQRFAISGSSGICNSSSRASISFRDFGWRVFPDSSSFVISLVSLQVLSGQY